MSPRAPKLADPGALIRAGKLRTVEHRVCLDPDLVDEHERLIEQRHAMRLAVTDSLAGPDTADLDAAIAEVLAEMDVATITLTLKALPRAEFRALIDRHPPRKGAEGNSTYQRDEQLGVAYEPFFDELLRTSIVGPELAAEDLAKLLDELLSDGEWDALTTVAWNLNRQTVDVPFSSAASRTTRRSARK